MKLGLFYFALFGVGYLWAAFFGTGAYGIYYWPTLVATAVCLLALPFGRGRRQWAAGAGACQLAAVLLLAYMAVRGIASPIPHLARSDLFFLAASFGVYALFTDRLSGRRAQVGFALLILVAGVANFAVATYQQAVDLEFCIRPGRTRIGSGRQLTRPSGLYNQSVHFGGFMAIALVLAVAFAATLRGRGFARLFCCACIPVGIVGIVMSQSRGAMLVSAIGIGIVGVLRVALSQREGGWFSNNRRMVVVAVCGVFVVAGGVLVKTSLQKRFGDDLSGITGLTGRGNFWGGAVDQWFDWPMFGAGAQSYHYRYLQYRPADAPFHQRDPRYAHNEYLQQGAEYGLVGVALLGFLVVAHIRNGLRAFWAARSDWLVGASDTRLLALIVAALAIGVSQLVHGACRFPRQASGDGNPDRVLPGDPSSSHGGAPSRDAGLGRFRGSMVRRSLRALARGGIGSAGSRDARDGEGARQSVRR